MVSFDEIEWDLGGKIKSVLVLALAVALVVQYGKAGTGGRVTAPAAGPAVEGPANPIDSFYADMKGQALLEEESSGRAYALLYLESWEQEFLHAGGCLAQQAREAYGSSDPYAGQAREAFAAYADAAGWLETMAGCVSTEATRVPADDRKTAALKAAAEAEIYREQTLRIYRLLQESGQRSPENIYVFDRQAAERELRECGLLGS